MHQQNGTTGVHVRLQQTLLTQIDEYRRRQAHLPTRPQAIRDLVEQAMSGQEQAAINPKNLVGATGA